MFHVHDEEQDSERSVWPTYCLLAKDLTKTKESIYIFYVGFNK